MCSVAASISDDEPIPPPNPPPPPLLPPPPALLSVNCLEMPSQLEVAIYGRVFQGWGRAVAVDMTHIVSNFQTSSTLDCSLLAGWLAVGQCCLNILHSFNIRSCDINSITQVLEF